jgi:hypothetical protein
VQPNSGQSESDTNNFIACNGICKERKYILQQNPSQGAHQSNLTHARALAFLTVTVTLRSLFAFSLSHFRICSRYI